MENLEEIKIRSITGGNLHRHSFVFHILYDGIYWDITKQIPICGVHNVDIIFILYSKKSTWDAMYDRLSHF